MTWLVIELAHGLQPAFCDQIIDSAVQTPSGPRRFRCTGDVHQHDAVAQFPGDEDLTRCGAPFCRKLDATTVIDLQPRRQVHCARIIRCNRRLAKTGCGDDCATFHGCAGAAVFGHENISDKLVLDPKVVGDRSATETERGVAADLRGLVVPQVGDINVGDRPIRHPVRSGSTAGVWARGPGLIRRSARARLIGHQHLPDLLIAPIDNSSDLRSRMTL